MDEMVVKEAMEVLHALSGNPCREKTLLRYVNNRLAGALTTHEFASQLADMKAKGWVKCRLDDFDHQTWYLTEAGVVQRERM